MFINGQWREAASNTQFTSNNPATGEAIDQIPAGGAEDAVAAIDAAHAAFPAWSGKSAYERSAILYKAHALMIERKDELAKLMTTEQGKPLRAAANETQYAADFLLWYAEEAKRVYGETIPSARGDQRPRSRRRYPVRSRGDGGGPRTASRREWRRADHRGDH